MFDDFTKQFSTLTRKQDASRVFMDYLTYTIDQFTLPSQKPEFKPEHTRYTKEDLKTFGEMFRLWITSMDEQLKTYEWFDYFGTFYEDVLLSNYKSKDFGQFFTPPDVCNLMLGVDIPKDYNPIDKVVNDPTCGSGRFLIAYQSQHQGSYLLGQDLDEFACKMCVLNMLIHGAVGVVVWKNTLSGEEYGAWRVNQYLNLMGMPSIERFNSEVEAVSFFPQKEITEDLVITEDVEENNEVIIVKKKDKQAILM